MDRDPFLERVRIRNYKSIGCCDVRMGRFTALVGRNGSGKSNFLDALRFVSDALQTSLDHAIRARGGINEVRRRSTGHPHNFEIRLILNLPKAETADYGFEIAGQEKGGFVVKWERLRIVKASGEIAAEFNVKDGQAKSPQYTTVPPASPDRLYLVSAAGLPSFRSTYDALLSMGFYNLSPEQMKENQTPDAGELLRRDGSNITSVVARVADDRPELKQRIGEYLRAIVHDVVGFDRVALGARETLVFYQQVKGSRHPWKFHAASMSDGTLRALGILVAAMQLANRTDAIRLTGIEEPETALHPAAAGALMEALREAAVNTQIVITTHSSDLLDQFQFDSTSDELLVVQSHEGLTEIGRASEVSREAISEHLYSPGELLRMDQLMPDREEIERQKQSEFGFEAFEANA